MKGRVDPLFIFYKGNLRLIRTINLHGKSIFWNFPHPTGFQFNFPALNCMLSFPRHLFQSESGVNYYCSLCKHKGTQKNRLSKSYKESHIKGKYLTLSHILAQLLILRYKSHDS